MATEESNNFTEPSKEKPSMLILLSYYCGVFSILPVVGLFLGPVAVLLGGVSLWKMRNRDKKPGIWIGRIGFLIGALAFGLQSLTLYSLFYPVS